MGLLRVPGRTSNLEEAMIDLRDWFDESALRWEENVGNATKQEVSKDGYWVISLGIPADPFFGFQSLGNAMVEESRNSPFAFVERRDQQDSCIVMRNSDQTHKWWCANRDVKTFCLLPFGQGWEKRVYGTAVVNRTSQAIDHAQRLARRINPDAQSFSIRIQWRGLAGKQLLLYGHDPVGDPAFEDTEPTTAEVPLTTSPSDPQLLISLVEPLFKVFRYRPGEENIKKWATES